MKSKNLKNILTNKNTGNTEPWLDFFKESFSKFEIIGCSSMVGLFLIVMVKSSKKLTYNVSLQDHSCIKLGFMNMPNKGGVYLEMKINNISIGLMTCHL